MNLDIAFSRYLRSVTTLNIFVSRKYRSILELCKYYICFLSNTSAVSTKKGRTWFPVCHKLMSVTFS